MPLRPLGVGDILGGAFGYIRANPVSTVVATALIFVAAGMVQVLVQALPVLTLGSRAGVTPGSVVAGLTGLSLIVSLISAVVGLLASALISGVLLVVLRRALLGLRTSLGEAWHGATRRVWGLIGATVLVGLIVGATAIVGMILAVVIGVLGRDSGVVVAVAVLVGLAVVALVVYLAVSLSMTPAAYVMEDIGVTTALARSRALVRGSWWRVFGIQLLAAVVLGTAGLVVFLIVGSVFGLGLGSLTGNGRSGFSIATLVVGVVVFGVAAVVLAALITPFTTGITGLLYADQRIRRERFDLELSARAAGQVGPGPAW